MIRINKEHGIDPDTSSAAILLSTVLRARSNGGGEEVGRGWQRRLFYASIAFYQLIPE